jgi:hypothetical protein
MINSDKIVQFFKFREEKVCMRRVDDLSKKPIYVAQYTIAISENF